MSEELSTILTRIENQLKGKGIDFSNKNTSMYSQIENRSRSPNNNSYYYDHQLKTQIDTKSNGAFQQDIYLTDNNRSNFINFKEEEFLLNYSSPQKTEIRKKYKINPYSNTQTEIKNLKKNEDEINKIKIDICGIQKNIEELQNNMIDLNKNIEDNSDLLQNAINENISKNKNIINKYNELEENFEKLNTKISEIKDEQNKSIKNMPKINNQIENNYQEDLNNLEIKIKNYIKQKETNKNEFDENITNKINEESEKNSNEILSLKQEIIDVKNSIKDLNNNLGILDDIPQIKNIINDLNNRYQDLLKRFNNKNDDNFNNVNAENNFDDQFQNIESRLNDIQMSINDFKTEINSIKTNLIDKNEIQEIKNNINVLEEKLSQINEKKENKEDSIIEIENDNKNENIIPNGEFYQLIQKKDNQHTENEKNIEKQVEYLSKKYDNDLNDLTNQIKNYNEEEIKWKTDIDEVVISLTDKIVENNKEIDFLKNTSIKNAQSFENIKRNFEIINENLKKMQIIEQKTNENYENFENLNNKINQIENVITNNKSGNLNDNAGNSASNDLILAKINELSNNTNQNLKNIENKLNDFINEQNIINDKNKEEITDIKIKLNEIINENEILQNNEKKNNLLNQDEKLEIRLNELENKVLDLSEMAQKLDKLNDKNQKEIKEKFDEVTCWVVDFKNKMNGTLSNMKNYIDQKVGNNSVDE